MGHSALAASCCGISRHDPLFDAMCDQVTGLAPAHHFLTAYREDKLVCCKGCQSPGSTAALNAQADSQAVKSSMPPRQPVSKAGWCRESSGQASRRRPRGARGRVRARAGGRRPARRARSPCPGPGWRRARGRHLEQGERAVAGGQGLQQRKRGGVGHHGVGHAVHHPHGALQLAQPAIAAQQAVLLRFGDEVCAQLVAPLRARAPEPGGARIEEPAPGATVPVGTRWGRSPALQRGQPAADRGSWPPTTVWCFQAHTRTARCSGVSELSQSWLHTQRAGAQATVQAAWWQRPLQPPGGGPGGGRGGASPALGTGPAGLRSTLLSPARLCKPVAHTSNSDGPHAKGGRAG